MTFNYCPVNYSAWPSALAPWERTSLNIFGLNRMLAPLKMPAGRPEVPSYTYWGDERTGRHSKKPGTEAFDIFGFERYRWEDGNLIFRDLKGIELTVITPVITTPTEVVWPSESGTLALVEDFNAENKDSVTILKGMVVCGHDSGSGIQRADASTATLLPALGFATRDAAVGFSAPVQSEGPLRLTDWSDVTEDASATLTAKSEYFLSQTAPGKIRLGPPDAGRMITVGSTKDTLSLLIEIDYLGFK